MTILGLTLEDDKVPEPKPEPNPEGEPKVAPARDPETGKFLSVEAFADGVGALQKKLDKGLKDINKRLDNWEPGGGDD